MKSIFYKSKILLISPAFFGLVSCSTTQIPVSSIPKNLQLRELQDRNFSKFVASTQGPQTSRIAREIFEKGGNIVDAAVAASFAISVERPQSTGIGGGGFFVYFDAKAKKNYAVDFRERAPLRAKEKMYLDSKGEIIPDLSLEGGLAAATPGLVQGLWEIHQKFGKLPWKEIVEPSILLAEKGFPVYPHLAAFFKMQAEVLKKFPASKSLFFKNQNETLVVGDLFQQPGLGKTLREISKSGPKGFYAGWVARELIKASQASGGILSQSDLDSYRVRWLEPLRLKAGNFELVTMPPPSSALHVLQSFYLAEKTFDSPNDYQSKKHFLEFARIFQRVFADRAEFLGDGEFYKVPVQGLISNRYLDEIQNVLKGSEYKKSEFIKAGNLSQLQDESVETTHLSFMDGFGNAISTTQSVNGPLGAGVVAGKAGFLLNNTMDDFSVKPGVPNMYGAIGGAANSIMPKKTPLSSMSPTLVFEALDQETKPVMAVGAPGGTRIITCTAQTLVNFLLFKRDLYSSVNDIRLHHQWLPDVLILEKPGPRPDILRKLEKTGLSVKIDDIPCRVMATALEGMQLHGVTDPRDGGVVEGI
jgi:gamma-glutamyltranspeptidase/glutathione hydrolase